MSKHVTLYGIPNCDTVKRARAWLTAHGVEAEFHDFKKAGLDATLVNRWLERCDWQTLVNRSGTTWRKLSDAQKAAVTSTATARKLMVEQPSVVKRPVVEAGATLLVGFDPQRYATVFK